MYGLDKHSPRRKEILAWAMYDWANSAFAVVILASFFPLMYREYWAVGLDSPTITWTLAVANSAASFLLMIFAVLLGSVADVGGRQKSFLIFFMAGGAIGTAALGFVALGAWKIALFVYVMATLGFMLSNVFYDALLVQVSPADKRERVSALGFALGYLGGGIFFALASAAVIYAGTLGFDDVQTPMRLSFYATALWWLVFSLPLIYFVKSTRTDLRIRESFERFKQTIRLIRQQPNVARFLIAYWLYIDGVDTIIRMAADYGRALGFDATHLILALLIVQFVSFPATLLYGVFAERLGAKFSILVAIAIYIAICAWGALIESHTAFYTLAILIGLVQGGIQSQSRSLFSHLIDEKQATQLFGIYNFLGRFAVIIGPLLLGWVGMLTQSPRMGILSIIILFVAGGLILLRVSESKSHV